MASFSGAIPTIALNDQSGATTARASANYSPLAGPPQWTVAVGEIDDLEILDTPWPSGQQSEGSPIVSSTDYDGVIGQNVHDDWFEKVHVIDRSINLGFFFSTQIVSVEIYNAYRKESRSLTIAQNNAGAGISFVGLPGLPSTILSQESLQFTLSVTTDGPAQIDGTIDYFFDEIDSDNGLVEIEIPIIGSRRLLFPFRPDVPYNERLGSLTDILKKRAGPEQRIGLRKNPRQRLEWTITFDNDEERQLFESMMFGFQDKAFGVPIWHEASILTAPIAINDSVITVDETRFMDYRVGGLAVIFDEFNNFEALTIQSKTTTTITFTTPFTKAFVIDTEVFPVRTGFVGQTIQGEKFRINVQRPRINFRIQDNDSNIGSTTPFPTFNSKVLLDEANRVDGTLSETTSQRLVLLDSETGIFSQSSNEDRSVRGHTKQFFSFTRQRLWEVRQLIHALRGRLVSFYIPTFFPDLEVTQPIVLGAAVVTIRNISYTDFVQSREPRNVIQVIENDGTKTVKTVTSSTVISATEEQLTISTTWPANIAVADIDRVEYFELVRFDDDDVDIVHLEGIGEAIISAPVKGIFT